MEGSLFISFVLSASLLTTPAPAECAEGLIHYMPYCLTVAEYEAITNPAPPAPVAPVHTGMGNGDVEQWRSMVAYYWPGWAVGRMLAIMDCESGGNPYAWNKSTDVRGLFQVRYPLWSKLWPGDYFDPWTNAAIAYQIWLEQGWRAWECAKWN